MRDAARKPTGAFAGNNIVGGSADREVALRVAYAARRRASKRLDDEPHRLRRPSYPAGRLRDLYGSLSIQLGIIPTGAVLCRRRYGFENQIGGLLTNHD